MTDFPRGWTYSNRTAAGSSPSLSAPAIAGVVHVLDAISAMVGAGAAAFNADVLLSSSDGTFTNMNLGVAAADASSTGSTSASGLDLAAGPGASLTITFDAVAPAAGFEWLMIQGHDI